MTAPDLTRFWGEEDDWTGLLLMIVPALQSAVPPQKLARLVRDRVEADAVLYDVVTVAHALPFDAFGDPVEWGRTLVASIMAASMPDRHFVAPRVVFGVVVVGELRRDIERVAREVDALTPVRSLRTQLYTLRIKPDDSGDGISPTSVLTIANLATTIMSEVEHRPEIAIDEVAFLAELTRLVQYERLTLPAPEPDPPAPPVEATAPSGADPTTASASVEDAPAAVTAGPALTALPAPTAPPLPAMLPTAQQSAPLVSPVIHGGADIVIVPNVSPLRRIKERAPTDADVVQALSQVTDAVSLAYLIFVPDDEPKPRELSKRRRTIALDLDRTLATVIGDTATGRPAMVAVEVLSARSPLHKHGALRPAGELTENALPKVSVEIFDLLETAEALLDAAQRSTRALHARKLDVLSLHFIFLAAAGPTSTSTSEWDRLLRHARITWVCVRPSKPTDLYDDADRAALFALARPSPFGVHALTDNDDVEALFRQESKVIYQFESAATAPVSVAAAPGGDEAPPVTRKARRWWRGRKAPERPS